ncbi:DUF1992 domain-containing protein [Streptomyces sp. NPDC058195]|uniref:DnaJ family domain-containing protein n=1 Tax=Streptomyces sp. NPDC058195 TaxID=3346375 RepID=UPI0036E5375B
MTERKPAGMSFESWVDKQVRESEQRGDFAKLEGFGKPLPSLEAPYDENWWIKQKLQREGVSVLPPTLALRKEAEDVIAALPGMRTEREVRSVLAGLNEKIRANLRQPPPGPPLNLKPFDADAVVAEWREASASA